MTTKTHVILRIESSIVCLVVIENKQNKVLKAKLMSSRQQRVSRLVR